MYVKSFKDLGGMRFVQYARPDSAKQHERIVQKIEIILSDESALLWKEG